MNYRIAALFLALVFTSCDVTTFTLRSKKKKQREMPSLLVFDSIIDFREKYGEWPSSREMLEYRDKKYYDAFQDFKYTYTKFKIKDSDNMEFIYADHVDDLKQQSATGKVDLNGYNGSVKFFKAGDKFAWKISQH